MFTPIGRSQSCIGRISAQRIARGPRRRVARSLVAAWLAVLALYAVVGSVAPAYAAKPLPTVTSVTPSSGPVGGGTSVTIAGTSFKKVKAVKFGSTNATSFTVQSQTSITAVSPPGATAGNVDVRVTTLQGTSSVSASDTFEFTPTITGVSPDAGPPAGGTPVTITGSGFAVGKSATGFRFGFREEGEEYGAVEAVGVNCTTTTECTATTPELSDLLYEQRLATVDVTAIVNNVASPQTPEDQFHYHGLYLVSQNGRLRLGGGSGFGLLYTVGGRETTFCSERGVGGVVSNGEATDVLDVSPGRFTCNGALSFALRLSEDGSAAIEGPMEVRNDFRCIYEGDQMTGSFELNAPLNARLGGTFALVREEIPGSECAATEHIELEVESEQASTELFG
jgi:hypothetical protein